MNTSTRSALVLVAVACVAIAGCKNDDVTENVVTPPAAAAKPATPPVADCSSHEAEIVKLSGALAASEAKVADLEDRVEELGTASKPAKMAKAKTVVCQACPEVEAETCDVVAETPAIPADTRTAAECIALDSKFEARYQFLSKTVAELEVENYLIEHGITELEKTVGKAKK